MVLTTDLPFQYNWDNSLTAPLNWTYAPQLSGRQLPYLMYNIESRLSSGLPALEKDTPIQETHRLTPFSGSPSQAIFVIYQPPGCLKVVDPRLDQRLPDKPLYFREGMAFSDSSLILPEANPAARPPEHILGPEPEHGWCYYYEKAELARQRGDWQEVARLGDLALAQGKQFYRKNVAELAPFIQGYAHVGNWEKATRLSLEAYQTWENMQLMLCDIWVELYRTTPANAQQEQAYQKMMKTLQCTQQ
jgi:hypothetical protein